MVSTNNRLLRLVHKMAKLDNDSPLLSSKLAEADVQHLARRSPSTDRTTQRSLNTTPRNSGRCSCRVFAAKHGRCSAHQLLHVDLGVLWQNRAQSAHRAVLSRDPHGEALPPRALAVGQRDGGRQRGAIGDRQHLRVGVGVGVGVVWWRGRGVRIALTYPARRRKRKNAPPAGRSLAGAPKMAEGSLTNAQLRSGRAKKAAERSSTSDRPESEVCAIGSRRPCKILREACIQNSVLYLLCMLPMKCGNPTKSLPAPQPTQHTCSGRSRPGT